MTVILLMKWYILIGRINYYIKQVNWLTGSNNMYFEVKPIYFCLDKIVLLSDVIYMELYSFFEYLGMYTRIS